MSNQILYCKTRKIQGSTVFHSNGHYYFVIFFRWQISCCNYETSDLTDICESIPAPGFPPAPSGTSPAVGKAAGWPRSAPQGLVFVNERLFLLPWLSPSFALPLLHKEMGITFFPPVLRLANDELKRKKQGVPSGEKD